MSSSKENHVYVEHCLCSVERLVREGDLELASLTLDFMHLDPRRIADKGQVERLKALKVALGRVELDAAGEEVTLSGSRLH